MFWTYLILRYLKYEFGYVKYTWQRSFVCWLQSRPRYVGSRVSHWFAILTVNVLHIEQFLHNVFVCITALWNCKHFKVVLPAEWKMVFVSTIAILWRRKNDKILQKEVWAMLKCSFDAIIWPLLAGDQNQCIHRIEVINLCSHHLEYYNLRSVKYCLIRTVSSIRLLSRHDRNWVPLQDTDMNAWCNKLIIITPEISIWFR